MWIRVNSMLHLFEWLLQLGNGDVVVNGGFAFGQHKKEGNIQARGLGDNLILELRSTDSRLKTPRYVGSASTLADDGVGTNLLQIFDNSVDCLSTQASFAFGKLSLPQKSWHASFPANAFVI